MKPKVLVVIPCYNEEKVLEQSISSLREFLAGFPDFTWMILIADNASTDTTLKVGESLSKKHSNVSVLHLDKKGRGRALSKAWSDNKADVYCYMDVDLATGLEALPKMVDEILAGSDVAFGNRYLNESDTKRSVKRWILSRGYNILLKLFLGVGFTDAQCGFKAVNNKAVDEIIPKIEDNNWFFDTELLVLSEWHGLILTEIPVSWHEMEETKVKTFETVSQYLNSIMRMRSRKS